MVFSSVNMFLGTWRKRGRLMFIHLYRSQQVDVCAVGKSLLQVTSRDGYSGVVSLATRARRACTVDKMLL